MYFTAMIYKYNLDTHWMVQAYSRPRRFDHFTISLVSPWVTSRGADARRARALGAHSPTDRRNWRFGWSLTMFRRQQMANSTSIDDFNKSMIYIFRG